MALASIVVVETDPVARERIARELRDLGYDVDASADIAAQARNPVLNQDMISAGGVSIDIIGQRVVVDGVFETLAPREYRLLLFLLSNQDRVFSRKQLLVHVWDRDTAVGSRTVDVHVRRLRSLLEPYGYDRYIQTVRGTGYRFSLRS